MFGKKKFESSFKDKKLSKRIFGKKLKMKLLPKSFFFFFYLKALFLKCTP
jgi:hypothetical protein